MNYFSYDFLNLGHFKFLYCFSVYKLKQIKEKRSITKLSLLEGLNFH